MARLPQNYKPRFLALEKPPFEESTNKVIHAARPHDGKISFEASPYGLKLQEESRLERPSDKKTQQDRKPKKAAKFGLYQQSVTIKSPLTGTSEDVSSEHKGGLAAAVLTRTYVHTFHPESCEDGEIRRYAGVHPQIAEATNATVQVVRARHSVYEAIWLDYYRPIKTHHTAFMSRETTSTSHKVNPVLRRVSGNEEIETVMASWSWEGLSEKGLEADRDNWNGHLTPKAGGELELQLTPLDDIYHKHDKGVSFSNVPAPGTSQDELASIPLEQEMVPSRRGSESGPSAPTQVLNPSAGHGKAVTSKMRRQLQEKRKPSDLPPETDHFTCHKDSLVLAHKRLLHDDRA